MRSPHLAFGHTDNKEINLYLSTTKTYFPSSTPSTFGLEAWLSAKLFVEAIGSLGANVTRARLFAALDAVKDWDGGGSIGPNTPSKRVLYLCNIMVHITKRDFVPESGFNCGPLYKLGDYTGPPVVGA
jgi:hypothetical protein